MVVSLVKLRRVPEASESEWYLSRVGGVVEVTEAIQNKRESVCVCVRVVKVGFRLHRFEVLLAQWPQHVYFLYQ